MPVSRTPPPRRRAKSRPSVGGIPSKDAYFDPSAATGSNFSPGGPARRKAVSAAGMILIRMGRRRHTPLAEGQLRSHLLLGLRSIYRVRAVEADHVLAEVVRVPGLAVGSVVRLRRSVVEGMAVADRGCAGIDDELHATLVRWAA